MKHQIIDLILILISISEPLPDEYNPHILQHDIGQNVLHTNQDDTTELFRNQETSHFNNIPDASETATIQSVSELSEKTSQNPQSVKLGIPCVFRGMHGKGQRCNFSTFVFWRQPSSSGKNHRWITITGVI